MKVDMFSGTYLYPGGPNFRPFCSTGHRLRVTANFSCGGGGGGGDDHGETNAITGERGYVQCYVTTAQGAQIFVRFALRATVSELQPILVVAVAVAAEAVTTLAKPMP